MENGGLADKLSGLTVNDAKDNNLIQVMNAVEAAESIIKQQVEENNRLRADIQRKNQELEILRLDKSAAQRSHPHESYDENGEGIFKAYETASTSDPGATLFFHHGATPKSEDYVRQFPAESYSGIRRNSSILNSIPVGHTNPNDAGFTQLSSPSTAPFSPGRDPMNGDYGPGSNVPGQGMIRVAELNNSINLWKQGLVQKTRENEEEIMQLRKQLTDYLIKETQMRNEKLILEKRIAHMRMAFDQQQQDLVDAASKALSYRQEIIEENVRLTYQLEDAQQERATFVSSLLPLLAEYSMQPPNRDAQSIVSSVKVLFKHLQEKLIITEAKLKESQYQLAPWRSDGKNPSFAAQFPHHSGGAALSSSKKGLELVPQQAYSPVNVATEAQMATDWVIEGHQAHQGGAVTKSMELDDFGRYSPLAGRNTAAHDVSSQVDVSRDVLHMPQYHGEAMNRHVKFKDPVTHSGIDKSNEEGHSNEGQNPGTRNWGSGASPYTNPLDEPSSYSPYLRPVPEEPSSSFSEGDKEAADDDPLPAVVGLQISGEAYPGQVLQASGYSINGTTCCNFEWVRHLEDGSINYIEGAKQPIYLVTADDVDTYLAIEVQPLDDRKRKGELVKVFANEHRKITTDPGMQSHIEKNLYTGYASYTISMWKGYADTWELATLTINRESYKINCREPNGDALNEKFSPATTVSVTPGHPSAFSISTSNGAVHLLRAEGIVPEISSLRDAIVLTLRWFVNKAGERKKGKKEKKRILFGYF